MRPRSAFLGMVMMLSTGANAEDNPLLREFDTPFGVPPFAQIHTRHYLPALKAGIERERAEVAAIASAPDAPTFANTIEALERAGQLLARVQAVFSVLSDSMTSDEMQQIATESAPLLSAQRDDILMNAPLFARVRAVWDQRAGLSLSPEQARLLERTHKSFVRGGANLAADKKERLRKINEELSLLSLRFGDNVLAENNRFQLVLGKSEELAGLPESAREAAAETARSKGLAGQWVFTLHKPSLIPFLQYSSRRDLREKMFKAYVNRGNHDDALDNKAVLSRMVALRAERARLLGFTTHADYVLDEAMAKTPARVRELLGRLWPAALTVARREAADQQDLIRAEGQDFALEPWDWWYYSNKILKAKYELDDELLRPYFKLENVVDGAFSVASRLFRIRFVERKDVPVYHPDVRVFEVQEEQDGRHVGILYVDYFPRESKRGGAWMNAFRSQSRFDGHNVAPIITNNGNFTKPTASAPSLLTLEEVTTLFHEFGHALHGLLSSCTYESLGGTSVAIDFVELPSQIMENWATDPTVLPTYARHFKTGAPIPAELIERMKRAERFNQGFATTEYLAASLLDLEWHTLTAQEGPSVPAFEAAAVAKMGLIGEIVPRYRSTYFQHIFGFDGASSEGYSSAYYSYIWAEVLDADAFEAFKQQGLFDPATALSFRQNILERGGTEEPMVLYKRFRGAEPAVEPLLKRRGLI